MKDLLLYHRDTSPVQITDTVQNYLIEVRGWPMLQGLEAGMYKVKFNYQDDYFGWVATFYKQRGRTPIVSHYVEKMGNIFMLGSNSDLNGLIYRGKYWGSVVI